HGGLGVTISGGALIPFQGLVKILGDSHSALQSHAEHELRVGVTLFGGAAKEVLALGELLCLPQFHAFGDKRFGIHSQLAEEGGDLGFQILLPVSIKGRPDRLTYGLAFVFTEEPSAFMEELRSWGG